MTRGRPVLLALVWLVAFNLRAGFIAVGPMMFLITADLDLSHTQASFFVALPTAMMGVAAVPGGRLTDRWGVARVIALGLALVALAGAARAAAPGFWWLVGLTILFGAGIGLVQPALPRLTRAWFPTRLGTATGIYASGMVTGSILGAALTVPFLVPLADEASWRLPLAIWGAAALAVLLLWVIVARRAPEFRTVAPGTAPTLDRPATTAGETARWSPWRDGGAWRVAAIFALQGLCYYLLVAWLPSFYGDLAVAVGLAGALTAVFNGATLPGILGFPALSDRIGARRPAVLAASVLFSGGALGLLAAPLAPVGQWAWAAAAGAGVAGLFAMGLVLPADLAPRGQTGRAAGMVLGVGYSGSALGPVLAGAVHDLTGSFLVAMALLPVIGLIMVGLSLTVPELPRTRASVPVTAE